MRKNRGFGLKLCKRIRWISNWIFRMRTRPGYHMLNSPKPKPISKLISWGRKLKNGAKSICLTRRRKRLNYEPLVEEKAPSVPKGYLTVYVGENDDDFHRVMVPIIYFNHPLFGELLREAEKEYGFQHQGGITIPCPYSRFENVQTRIKSGSGLFGRKPVWKLNSNGRRLMLC